MMIVIWKIFYGIEKNIDSPNYLQILKVWIVFLTYTLLKEKIEQNTDVVIFSLDY